MKRKQHLYHGFSPHNSSDYNMEISKFRLQLWNWQHWMRSQDELLPGWVTPLAKLAGHFRCVAGIALAAAASFLLAKHSAVTAASTVCRLCLQSALDWLSGTKAFLSSWTLAKRQDLKQFIYQSLSKTEEHEY